MKGNLRQLNSSVFNKIISSEQNDKIKDLRRKAYISFEKLDMPDSMYGNGIRLNQDILDTDNINPLIDSSEKSTNKIGQIYSHSILANPAKLSNPRKTDKNKEGIICPLKDAIKKYPDKVIQYFASAVPYNENKFISLHYATVKDGLFVYIPKNKVVNLKIKSKILSKTQFEHILIIADELSNVTLIEENQKSEKISEKDNSKQITSKTASKNICFRHQVVELIAKQSSKVNYITIQHLPKDVVSFSTKRSIQDEGSSVTWTDIALGSAYNKIDVQNILSEQGAKSQHYGLYYGKENQMFDIYGANIHRKSHTNSDIKVRIALDENAKALFRGLIRIDPYASSSEGDQKEDTLLLSENAEANAIPNLEIENHDVKCSHGATISYLDNEQLFYITSRGVPKNIAKHHMTLAFMHPIIKNLPAEIIDGITKLIDEKISSDFNQ